MVEDRILTPDEAAEFLKVTRRWLMREGIGPNGIPYVRGPRTNITTFRLSALLAWAEANEQTDNRGSGFGGHRPKGEPVRRKKKVQRTRRSAQR